MNTKIEPFTERRRSVFNGDNANDFVTWLSARLAGIPEEDRKNATMVAHPIADDFHGGVMVGIRYVER